MLPRGGRMYDYPPGRNMPEGAMPGIAGGMPSVPYDMAGNPMRDAENLYPDQLEHEMAAKVTGMLLEMDQTEALYLLESPEELKAKVAEAMKLLRKERSAAATTI
ncbi:hypothetical protein MKW94_012002 [Papaver nudicaule]|uniref:PABC domain-containing protein n=1 Tax=Papaver nudicaule TaxID=74823 RepID=A0AA41VMJ7_PAPNU|nr:hypothetical protein [Papaver nudicaule]